MKKGIESLHTHTTVSDGECTYQEAVGLCLDSNISIVAFTDHDALPTEKTIDYLRSGLPDRLRWISGIEISSGLPQELGGGAYSNLHIVGLGIDPTYRRLKEHCQQSQEARVTRMRDLVANLKNLGFELTEEGCLAASGGETVGRPHIVEALNFAGNSHNRELLLRQAQQMAEAAASDEALKTQYERMLSRGEDQYPYFLFLDGSAFIKGVYVDYLYWLNFDKSVSLIRDSGGVATLAHYFTARTKITPQLLETMFEKNRLDGAETVFGFDWYLRKSKDVTIIEQDRQMIRILTDKYGKLSTGGADIHRRSAFAEFTNATWYSQETAGMAQKVVAKLGSTNDWYRL